MPDAPKPFWYFAGTALLVVALAVAWRIARTNQPVTVAGEGLSLTLGQVQSSIADAQQTVTQVQQQSEQQRVEIAQLEQQLSADQKRIAELIAEIQRAPQAPASLKTFAAQQAKQAAPVLPPISTVNPALLQRAQVQLDSAKRLTAQLIQTKR